MNILIFITLHIGAVMICVHCMRIMSIRLLLTVKFAVVVSGCGSLGH